MIQKTKKKRVSIDLDEDFFELLDQYIKLTKKYKSKKDFFVKIAEEKLENDSRINEVKEFMKKFKANPSS